MQLELEDGAYYRGVSFGAERSVAGELVFQTGMVGYPEAITDPSYQGQILVITFPLVGNYGVPCRTTADEILSDVPAHFESSRIHVLGLIVASYSGEDYSHYLATSSLGTWLKEQGVPAMSGIDTRLLTQKIRNHGSMLGKMCIAKKAAMPNGTFQHEPQHAESSFEQLEWVDPNKQNLVAQGERSESAKNASGEL